MSDRISCFIIMPYSARSDEVYRSAVLPVLRDFENVLALRADEMGRVALTLKAHVEDSLQAADFCLVDLTDANPNVMYELGYAMAKRKPMVCVRSKQSGPLPSDIVAGEVIEYDLQNLRQFRHELSMRCAEVIRQLSPRSPDPEQRAAVYEPASKQVEQFIASARSQLWTMAPSPKYLAPFVPQLRDSAKRGVNLRIVYPDPESEFVRARATEQQANITLYRQDLVAAIAETTSVLAAEGRASQVRLTEKIATILLYLSESRALVYPYPAESHKGRSLAIEIDAAGGTGAFATLQRHFTSVWESAVRISSPAGRERRDRRPRRSRKKVS